MSAKNCHVPQVSHLKMFNLKKNAELVLFAFNRHLTSPGFGSDGMISQFACWHYRCISRHEDRSHLAHVHSRFVEYHPSTNLCDGL